jgi:hypothetical protein
MLPRMEYLLVGDVGDLEAFHGLTRPARGSGNNPGIFARRGGCCNRPGTLFGIVGLEYTQTK